MMFVSEIRRPTNDVVDDSNGVIGRPGASSFKAHVHVIWAALNGEREAVSAQSIGQRRGCLVRSVKHFQRIRFKLLSHWNLHDLRDPSVCELKTEKLAKNI